VHLSTIKTALFTIQSVNQSAAIIASVVPRKTTRPSPRNDGKNPAPPSLGCLSETTAERPDDVRSVTGDSARFHTLSRIPVPIEPVPHANVSPSTPRSKVR
jgi:hypothetical protein